MEQRWWMIREVISYSYSYSYVGHSLSVSIEDARPSRCVRDIEDTLRWVAHHDSVEHLRRGSSSDAVVPEEPRVHLHLQIRSRYVHIESIVDHKSDELLWSTGRRNPNVSNRLFGSSPSDASHSKRNTRHSKTTPLHILCEHRWGSIEDSSVPRLLSG